jgi:isopenicillin N synthase-like dioxygenase
MSSFRGVVKAPQEQRRAGKSAGSAHRDTWYFTGLLYQDIYDGLQAKKRYQYLLLGEGKSGTKWNGIHAVFLVILKNFLL